MTYSLRRLIRQLIPVLFVASFLIFVSVRLIPGDPALDALGDSFSAVNPEVYEELRRQLGLDKPIYVQYPLWSGRRPVTVATARLRRAGRT